MGRWSIGNSSIGPRKLKPRVHIWMECPEPKEQGPGVYGGLGKKWGRMGFWENLRIGHWVVGGSKVNYQLLSRSLRLKPPDCIWMDSVEPEYEVSDAKDGRTQLRERFGFGIISGKARRCSGGRSVIIKVFQRIQGLKPPER